MYYLLYSGTIFDTFLSVSQRGAETYAHSNQVVIIVLNFIGKKW